MLSNEEYTRYALELNLFFLRIIKEHTILAAASLPPRDQPVGYQLLYLKNRFEKLLGRTIKLSDGIVSSDVISSGELVTEFTLQAEEKTQFLTGIPIDMGITRQELQLSYNIGSTVTPQITEKISKLNTDIMNLMNIVLNFKKTLLKSTLNCKSFSYTYPLMLDHVIREGMFYVTLLNKLESKEKLEGTKELIQQEITWNDIMREHSKFIRGYLDPSEDQLFETANDFVKVLDVLVKETLTLPNNPTRLPEITQKSLSKVKGLRNFKIQGLKGILSCQIKSVIPPLLGDHVTREANHYLRLLSKS